jgi:hypothetical protein
MINVFIREGERERISFIYLLMNINITEIIVMIILSHFFCIIILLLRERKRL